MTRGSLTRSEFARSVTDALGVRFRRAFPPFLGECPPFFGPPPLFLVRRSRNWFASLGVGTISEDPDL